ncbi:MAG: bifunctional metallophosphatase/5'-nucleotidase [Proteobacteria bacterium]|nr:bifunctional metallophosphatase/5'-nucleotidase [Pseudomonadota bacterium]MDA1356088.1 bifunctional metallophosphatase/5'-nucleotidase [Pseudomonadota bacterium]
MCRSWGVALALGVLALCVFALAAPAFSGELKLTILHTNDVHSRLAATPPFGSACNAQHISENKCLGGAARHASAINSIRAEGGNVVLLDAGDQFQGTLFFTYYSGQAAAQVMNRLGYDAMAVGNHEFDNGPATLARFAGRIDFPLLAANMDVSADTQLAGRVAPWTVLEFGGEKLGVIGLITEETPSISSPGRHIQFADLTESLKEAVAALQRMGIDKIIALGHVGYWRDMDLARAVDGIDIIVGGHSHTYLSSDDPTAAGPYPTLVTSPGGETVLVVQAYQWSRYLGRLDVSFDAVGRLSAWHGAPILMDNNIPEEPSVAALVAKLNEPLHEIRNEVVGASARALSNETCRNGECALGNMLADIMLWRTASEGSEIAIANGGGIRAGVPAGAVTRGDVLQVLPFGNTLATFGLRGRDVVKALEIGLSRPGSGAFPQVAGLRFVGTRRAWRAIGCARPKSVAPTAPMRRSTKPGFTAW